MTAPCDALPVGATQREAEDVRARGDRRCGGNKRHRTAANPSTPRSTARRHWQCCCSCPGRTITNNSLLLDFTPTSPTAVPTRILARLGLHCSLSPKPCGTGVFICNLPPAAPSFRFPSVHHRHLVCTPTPAGDPFRHAIWHPFVSPSSEPSDGLALSPLSLHASGAEFFHLHSGFR